MSQRGRTGGSTDASGGRPWVFLGRAACAIGLFCVLWGTLNISVAYEVLGILLGVAGYALGARRLGSATVAMSTVSLFLVLAATQGYIPGFETTDPRSGTG